MSQASNKRVRSKSKTQSAHTENRKLLQIKRPSGTSKQARVIALLQSQQGATLSAMTKVTGWQLHSVRGFLAGVVRKRLKLSLVSREVDGIRVYRISKTGSVEPKVSKAPRAQP